MVRLHLFSSAETEMEQFDDLDSPDLYHEYHMSSSGSLRRGYCACLYTASVLLVNQNPLILPNLDGNYATRSRFFNQSKFIVTVDCSHTMLIK